MVAKSHLENAWLPPPSHTHLHTPYTHLRRLVAKAGDVNDGDHLKGHHPLVLDAVLLTQLRLLLQVLRGGKFTPNGCENGCATPGLQLCNKLQSPAYSDQIHKAAGGDKPKRSLQTRPTVSAV